MEHEKIGLEAEIVGADKYVAELKAMTKATTELTASLERCLETMKAVKFFRMTVAEYEAAVKRAVHEAIFGV